MHLKIYLPGLFKIKLLSAFNTIIKLLTRFSSKILFIGLLTFMYSKRSNKNALGFCKYNISLCKSINRFYD